MQIGDSPDAKEFLEKLDNELKYKHNIHDMVDTMLYERKALHENPATLIKALLGGVDRAYDNDVPDL